MTVNVKYLNIILQSGACLCFSNLYGYRYSISDVYENFLEVTNIQPNVLKIIDEVETAANAPVVTPLPILVADFSLALNSCDIVLSNTSTIESITSTTYTISLDSTVIDTITTTSTDQVWRNGPLYEEETVSIQQAVTSPSGITSQTETVSIPVTAPCLVKFTSNANAGDSIYVEFPGSDGVIRVGTGTPIVGNTLNSSGSTYGFDSTNQLVRYSPDNLADIATVTLQDMKIVGAFDASNLTSTTSFNLSSNPNLTSFTAPTSTVQTILLDLSATGLTSVDISPFSNLGGDVELDTNPSLTTITTGSSSVAINSFRVNNSDITGVLDVSNYSNLGGTFRAQNNPNLTGISFPTSSNSFSSLWANSCDLTGTLDLSTIDVTGSVRLFFNSNLTQILHGPNTSRITSYRAYNSNLTGTLDLSSLDMSSEIRVSNNPLLTGLTIPVITLSLTNFQASDCNLSSLDLTNAQDIGGTIRVHANSNMSSLTFTSSSREVTSLYAYDCALTSLDVSMLSGLAGDIRIYNNPLTSLTLPAATSFETDIFRVSDCTSLGYFDITGMTFSDSIDFEANSCGMTTAQVNQMLVELNNTVPATGTGAINIAGTNAAPDASSGSYDGLGAAASLAGKGYTVVTS